MYRGVQGGGEGEGGGEGVDEEREDSEGVLEKII